MVSKKTIGKISGGLVALVLGATIALKDNVHLGSVTLPENSKRNQYALGIYAEIKASGTNITGNHYSVSLLGGGNNYATNSTHTGHSTSVSLLGGGNDYATDSVHTGDSTSVGLGVGVNFYAANSVHTGNSTSVGLILGRNDYATDSVHTGDSTTRGIFSFDKKGRHFFGNKIPKTQEQSEEDSK